MNTDQYNQQSWFNQLENPIRQRESNIGDQELTDMYRGQERADQALQFKNTKNYIDDTYSQYQNMSREEWNARMEFLSKFKPKDSEKKYGGKIKPKLKKKSVNNR
jgi:conjugal transfer/entry exclusion protein